MSATVIYSVRGWFSVTHKVEKQRELWEFESLHYPLRVTLDKTQVHDLATALLQSATGDEFAVWQRVK